MRKFNFTPDDLAYLNEGKKIADSKRLEISILSLGMEAYILGVVLPKLGIGPEEKVHVKYFLDTGAIEVYDQGENENSVPSSPEADKAEETKPDEVKV